MKRDTQTLLLLLGLAGVAYWWYNNAQKQSIASNPDAPPPDDATSFLSDPVAAVAELVTPWKQTGSASDWLPALAFAEQAYGIPTDLLARLAYQESHFREDVIRGVKTSSVGALGMMQLMPQYFPVVNAPRPYSDEDVAAQISAAADQLSTLYGQLGSWPLALAGYNAGAGAVKKYGGIPPFPETQQYVADITRDVPGLSA
jgi:soluble lytic murein transglycosylase-like protein